MSNSNQGPSVTTGQNLVPVYAVLDASGSPTGGMVANGQLPGGALTPTVAAQVPTLVSGAGIGATRRPRAPRPALYPAAVATPPTFATSGPGGAPPITGGYTNQFVPYNGSNVKLWGCVPLYFSALGTDYYQNYAAALAGSGAPPSAVEFEYYGADLAVVFRNASASNSQFWLWTNDPVTGLWSPCSAAPLTSSAATANNKFYYRVTFASADQRLCRLYYRYADFGGIHTAYSTTISAPAASDRILCVIGDSYVAGALTVSPLQCVGLSLGRLLGCETFLNAVAGSGYVSAGSGVAFADSTRVTSAIASGATDFLLLGSINDSSQSTASVTAAATSLIAALWAGRPGARIWMSGPQGLPVAFTSTGNNVANNTALAALAAAQSIPYIDTTGANWFNGTGHSGATASDGNRDVLCGTDSIHPTQAGHDYFAARLYQALMAAGW